MRPFQALLLVLLVGAASATAQEDRKAVDQQVYNSLRTVINYGADLYNNRDAAGCYHVFRTACVVVEPILEHRPDLQKVLRESIAEAEKSPDMAKRAWVLRKALDQVRATVKPAGKEEKKADEKKEEPKKIDDKKEDKKIEDKKDDKKIDEKKEDKQTLWQRLGGEPAVKKVVDDWFELAINDAKVNLTRNNQFQPTPDQVDNLKKLLVAQISSASGGPIKYTGRDMKAVHKGMAITNAEFDAAADNLKKALEMNKADAVEIKEVLKIVESTRKDIVEKQ